MPKLSSEEVRDQYKKNRKESVLQCSDHIMAVQKEAAVSRINKLLDSSGLPGEFVGSMFSDLSLDNSNQINIINKVKRYTKDLMDNKNTGANLIFMGGPGIGKSMIAACISNQINISGITSMWVNMPDLIRLVRDAATNKNNQTESNILNSLVMADVLFIDEFGRHQASDFNKQFVWNLIFKRHELRKPIVATTNSTELELKKILDEAAVSRLTDNGSQLMLCNWPTYRGRV